MDGFESTSLLGKGGKHSELVFAVVVSVDNEAPVAVRGWMEGKHNLVRWTRRCGGAQAINIRKVVQQGGVTRHTSLGRDNARVAGGRKGVIMDWLDIPSRWQLT